MHADPSTASSKRGSWECGALMYDACHQQAVRLKDMGLRTTEACAASRVCILSLFAIYCAARVRVRACYGTPRGGGLPTTGSRAQGSA